MIIHSGAGSGKFLHEDVRFRELRNAFEEGWNAMKRGSSLEGVEGAVRYMEECGAFNAGRGSCLTVNGEIQLDAAIMRGDTMKGAGVGLVTCTYHPVSLARWLMENTSHLLMVGDDCNQYVRAAGMKPTKLVPLEASRERLKRLTSEATGSRRSNVELWKALKGGSTVGAVAIDSSGLASAAVSTGGVWLKLPGRVGDSAIIGAGIYADKKLGAACATGTGEEIIRNFLCFNACKFMSRLGAQPAARRAIALMSKRSGKDTAGIITVDAKGRTGASWNTEAMGRAWYDNQKQKIMVRI
jgi:beta-aspartyl-peptidase (threonine type)